MSVPFPAKGDAPVRVLFIEELSRLIGKAPTTIRTCATNAKYLHLIPRPFKMPNSRRLCWWESDVLAWINASREPPPPAARRPRGRPTKAQQAAWQRQTIESRSQAQGAR